MKKIMLGTLDTWSMSPLSQQPSILYCRLSDFYLNRLSFQYCCLKKNYAPSKRISPHFDYHHDVRPRTGICTHKIQAIVFCPSARTIQHLLYHIQTALVYPLVCQDLFEVAFDLLYAFTILNDSKDNID